MTAPAVSRSAYVPQALAWWLLLSAAAVAAIFLARPDWTQWAPATCMPDACFCEGIQPGPVAQPANTWSNLGFVLAGLLMITRARAEARLQAGPANPMTRQTAYAWVLGVATIITGLGSVFYHASLSFVGQFFDVLGMYLLAVFILLYGVSRLVTMSRGAFVGLYVGLNAALAAALWTVPIFRRYLFAALILAAIGVEIGGRKRQRGAREGKWFLAAFVTLAVAFGIWNLDIRHIVCVPESLAQGHAVWHLLDAVATWFVYLYFRSETPGIEVQQIVRDSR